MQGAGSTSVTWPTAIMPVRHALAGIQQTTESMMRNIISAIAVTAGIMASGAAFAQAGTATSGNSGIRDRDALMQEKGMMVRIYDKAGNVYYDGQPRYMRKAKGTVGVYFPAFSKPVEERFFDAPDHSERSAQ
jgi:hypothetical protein